MTAGKSLTRPREPAGSVSGAGRLCRRCGPHACTQRLTGGLGLASEWAGDGRAAVTERPRESPDLRRKLLSLGLLIVSDASSCPLETCVKMRQEAL